MGAKYKVLHLASFDGNIGDIANHEGFYGILRELFADDFEVNQLEIRKFYNNCKELRFDDEFIKLVNAHDLLVVGGGAFLAIEWEYSKNGTTFDMGSYELDRIKCPVILNDMTFRQTPKTNDELRDRFKSFADYCIKSSNILFTVRNDGSYARLVECYGNGLDITNIHVVPDGGFYAHIPNCSNIDFGNAEYMTVNMAGDHGFANNEDNIRSVSNLINHYLDKGNRFMVFVPHVYKDFRCFSTLCKYLDDKRIRDRVISAQLVTGKRVNGLKVLDIYRNAELNLGMRFHSNVCSINMLTPTIGFGDHPVIKGVYDEMGISYRYLFGNEIHDEKSLQMVDSIIYNRKKFVDENRQIISNILNERMKYVDMIRRFCFG